MTNGSRQSSQFGNSVGDLPEHASPAVRQLQQERRRAAELGAALPGTPLADWAERFGPATAWPEDLSAAPIVVDVPIGNDPESALALAAVARTLPELALVVTSDETGGIQAPGQRARFARWLLDGLGRPDTAVAAGHPANDKDRAAFYVDEPVPARIEQQPSDVVAAVAAVCAATAGPVRWIGLGSMTNLAEVIELAPDSAHRFRVVQVEDALEHDPAALVLARVAARRLPPLEVITAEVANDPAIVVDRGSDLYQVLARPRAPEWATVLAAHLDSWFARRARGVQLRGALAMSAALDLPFVLSADAQIDIDTAGRIQLAPGEGAPARVSQSALYSPLMAWLVRCLDPDQPAVVPDAVTW